MRGAGDVGPEGTVDRDNGAVAVVQEDVAVERVLARGKRLGGADSEEVATVRERVADKVVLTSDRRVGQGLVDKVSRFRRFIAGQR